MANTPGRGSMTGRGLPPSQDMLNGPPMGRVDAPNNSLAGNRGMGRPPGAASDSLRVAHTTGAYQGGGGPQPSQGDLSHLLPHWAAANPQLRPMDDTGKQQPGSK